VLEAAGAENEAELQPPGAEAVETHGDPLPPEIQDSIRRNHVALKGPVTTPVGKGFKSVNVRLRQELELYANLRPVRTLAGVPHRFDNVNLVVVRENTEGLYSGLEHTVVPGVVESLKIITEKASTRIARFAFEHARANGRKRVVAIHKANILKLGDGLFLRSIRDVAREYTDIGYDEKIIDAACMSLVMTPEKFDVLVLPNLYGDIVSDLGAGLVGGLGVVPGANMGETCAVFEAVHGSAPDIADKNLANPTALLLSGLMMLDHIGEREMSARIRAALGRIFSAGVVRTRDLGGEASTTEFTEAICREIEKS
jgi:isocitrate dehydrogenase (NAD+)